VVRRPRLVPSSRGVAALPHLTVSRQRKKPCALKKIADPPRPRNPVLPVVADLGTSCSTVGCRLGDPVVTHAGMPERRSHIASPMRPVLSTCHHHRAIRATHAAGRCASRNPQPARGFYSLGRACSPTGSSAAWARPRSLSHHSGRGRASPQTGGTYRRPRFNLGTPVLYRRGGPTTAFDNSKWTAYKWTT
jgi:hypothetical protein